MRTTTRIRGKTAAMNSTKVCPMCKRRLPLDCFYSNKGRSDGVATYCKPCYRDKTNCNRAVKREKER